MVDENTPQVNVTGGSGIVAGGNVTFGNINGQFAAGSNINQTQTLNQIDLKEFRDNLLEFQKGIDKLGPEPDDLSIVNGNITAAVKEAKKDDPQLPKIKAQLENVNGVLNEAAKTVSSVSKFYEPAKKVFKALGIVASFLL